LSLLQYTDSDYHFGICWPLCCLSFFNIQILITPLVDNAMVKRYQRGNQNLYIEEEQTKQWPKDTKGVIRIRVLKKNRHGFWLPLWYLLVIVLSVLLQYTDSDYPFGIFWSLCCLFFFNIQILITDNAMVKRYQRGNQNLYIEEEQTTQWPKDTKVVIRISLKNAYIM
jgi:hypothetical protein